MAKEKQRKTKSRYSKKLEIRKREFGTLTLKVPILGGEKTITIVRPRPLYE